MRKTNKTPKTKQWIVALCQDSYNFEPQLVLISRCNKEKPKVRGFRAKSTTQKHCDRLNSM